MRGNARRLLLHLFSAGLVFFAALLLYYLQGYEAGQQEYENIRSSFQAKEGNREYIQEGNEKGNKEANTHKTPSLKESHLSQPPPYKIQEESLKTANPDYEFWLIIPGTSINYPVVQNKEEGYYLDHTFSKSKNSCGTLFIQKESKLFEDDNTIIFGHNRKDGSMFGQLKQYRDPEFYSQHSQIWIYRKGRWYQGEIFSCQIWKENDYRIYQKSFHTPEERQTYLETVKTREMYPTNIIPEEDQLLITLSTCYGTSQRMIVQAVLMCYTE